MHTFASKKPSHQTRSTRSGEQRWGFMSPNHTVSPIHHLQCMIGNHAVQRLIETNADDIRGDSSTTEITRFGHDFSRIPVRARMPIEFQKHPLVSIPPQGVEDEIIEAPRFVITPVPIEAPQAVGPVGAPVRNTPQQASGATACDVPLSMTKVTSGPFQGGLKMGDYYPDLSGRGFWQHEDTAGPWDTGSRAGVNVQLFGTVPSPCRPEQFRLEQTVTRERERINGRPTAREGTSSDDIAQSGRDASQAPFRQEWLGGGLNISMADPPSGPYSATQDIEYKKHFVTALRGPGGRRSVNWSIELKAENGTVTRNTVT